jgi:syntaxin 5
MKDRTAEFHSAVESAFSTSSVPLLNDQAPTTKSEFSRAAAAIANELTATLRRLDALAKMARSSSALDDKPEHVNQMVADIKVDIAKIARAIGALSARAPSNSRTLTTHTNAVVSTLQSKLANTSSKFRDILQVRSASLKEQQSRREQYGYNNSLEPIRSDSPLFTPAAAPSTSEIRQRMGTHTEDTVLELPSGGDAFGFGPVQQQVTSSVNLEVIESRSQAIESIESTIAELGQIYQHFAQLISTQRESIQRIDDNIVDTEMNVLGAHNQLLQYYESISSNRWLMAKMFAVLIFFFVIFVVFM